MNGRVFTRAFTFETRQYSIPGLDLGEGIPRKMFMIGAAATICWAAAFWYVFGPPSGRTLTLYVALPAVVTYYGFLPSTRMARRKKIVEWYLRAHYVMTGHHGIINGVSVTRRADQLSLRERVSLRWLTTYVRPSHATDPWTRLSITQRPFTGGRSESVSQTVYLTRP